MAKVLDIQEITLPSALNSTQTSGYYYNGYYYINTYNKIYKYDYINNVLTILYNKSTESYYCLGINDNIYSFYYNQTARQGDNYVFNIILYVYNITNNTYTELGSSNCPFVVYGHEIVSLGINMFSFDGKKIYICNSMFEYKSTSNGYTNFYSRLIYHCYNIDTNSFTYNTKGGTDNGYIPCITQPIIYNNKYYYNMTKYNEILNNTYNIYRKNLGFIDVFIDSWGDEFLQMKNLSSLDYDIRYNAIMKKEDGIYYLIGGYLNDSTVNRKLYELNLTSQTLTETTYVLPEDFRAVNAWFVQGENEGFIFTKTKAYKFSFIEYNNIYNISNSKGDFIYQTLTEQSPISKLKFTQSGDNIGYNFTTITGDVTGIYTPQIPSGYKLIGYSPSPNSTKAIIPLDTEITYNVLEDFTFYEVYGKYRPIYTPFSIKLYQNKAEANRVDKTNYITLVKEVLGVLRESTSIIDFAVVLELDTFPNFNYVYIEIFNRYYFVSDIVSVNKNIWEVSLSCDVLMSYKDAINACTGFVDRNENTYNLLIVDDKLPLKQGQTITTAFVNNTLFDDIQGTYVLQGLLVTQGDIVTPQTQTTETTTKEDK
jgi:hypothetical protein